MNKGFPTSKKSLGKVDGYPNVKDADAQYVTIQNVGSDRNCNDVVNQVAYRISPLVADLVEANSTVRMIKATAHGAQKGDFVRFETGAANPQVQMGVAAVPDANTIILSGQLDAVPLVGDGFYVHRYVTPLHNSDGSTATGPVTFYKDSVLTNVSQDTVVPANSEPLPSKILDDNGVPVDWTTLNQEVTQLAIAADIANIETATQSIDSKLNTLGQKTSAGSVPVVIASDQSAVPISAASLPLPTGAATEATLAAILADTTNIDTSTAAAAVSLASIENSANNIEASVASIDAGMDVLLSTRASEATVAAILADTATIDSAAAAIAASTASIDGKLANNYGVATAALRTAAQIGNASGVADFNSGATGAQTVRVVANMQRAGNELSYNTGNSDANTQRVVLASDQPAVAVTGTLTTSDPGYKEKYTLNLTSISTSAYTQLAASTTNATTKAQFRNTSLETMILATGAAAAEVDRYYIEPGNSIVVYSIAASTRLSVKAAFNAITEGLLTVNFF